MSSVGQKNPQKQINEKSADSFWIISEHKVYQQVAYVSNSYYQTV